MPKRCSFGCRPSGASLHTFPDPKKHLERFKIWVSLVGGKLEKASDYDLYRANKVCAKHFTNSDYNRNNRLNALAVPSRYLSGASNITTTAVKERSLSQNSTSSVVLASAVENDGYPEQQQAQSLIPQVNSAETEMTAIPNLDGIVLPVTPQPSSSGVTINEKRNAAAILMEHSYTAIAKTRRNLYREDVNKRSLYSLKPLKTEVKYLRTEICRLRKRSQTFKERLDSVNKLSKNICFNRTIERMKKPAQLFLHMQLQCNKKPKGRRFNIEEKVLALSLYKKSPKCYGLLYKYFTLPSARSMKRLLSLIKLNPGINPIIFEKIKKTVLDMKPEDKLCSLIFDEMSITPQIFYNANKDIFEGFTTDCNSKFADHALVFMIKGIRNNFKQPIAYYFTNALKKIELKKLITNVVGHIQKSGLTVINTVCDQSTINVSAITELVEETRCNYIKNNKMWRHDIFSVNNKNIIPLYDVPHLIKGIRNNLITKDMIYTINNDEKIVRWEYYQMAYAADKPYGELRMLNKLTEEHLNAEKINKMRVKTATQLFSRSMAVATEHLTARGDLPTECRQLIDITILLDSLFDSLNGSSLRNDEGKPYKGPVRRHSPHHELWQKAKKVLKSIKFLQKKKVGDKIQKTETCVPSVKNFIKTIEGMEAIWKILLEKYGFDAMLTRNFNQDPLENFFGNIRSYGARNIAPNSVSFESAFKAILLNNYNTPHSSKFNCEEDKSDCLQTLDFFLKESSDIPDDEEETEEKEDTIFVDEEMLKEHYEDDAGQRNYVCGWFLSKCLKKVVKSCKYCRNSLLEDKNINSHNAYIKAKEYNREKKWLCYPNEKIEKCFHDIQNITLSFLKENVCKNKIKNNIIKMTDMLVVYPLDCKDHKDELKKYFTDVTINVLLHSWCRNVNRILSGKINYDGNDPSKIAAKIYYEKRKHYKNKK